MTTKNPTNLNSSVVIKELPSGEILLDIGADGTYIRFDCDCLDALPYCKAACCSLPGIRVNQVNAGDLNAKEPLLENNINTDLVVWDGSSFVMKRDPCGSCCMLNKGSRHCRIYEDRPETCRVFHCTRGDGMRGWRLELERQKEFR